MRLIIQKEKIQENNLLLKTRSSHCGGIFVFEGRVRLSNNKKLVKYIEYECHYPLAYNVFQQLIKKVKKKFQLNFFQCRHRVGKVKAGECALWLGIRSIHRNDSIAACDYIITYIKNKFPIWKKEIYYNLEHSWINDSSLLLNKNKITNKNKKAYYSRQIIIPNIGEKGQKTLENKSILIVGAGGLGSVAITYLIRAGIGKIGICEYDVIEISNLHRQILYSFKDIGKKKSYILKEQLKDINPFIKIEIYQKLLNIKNIKNFFKRYDLILDCTDNFSTKFLINDAAFIYKKPIIRASVHHFFGQIEVYNSNWNSACMRCLWSIFPDNQKIGTCSQNGIIGAVTGVIGSLQALTAIKYLLNIGEELKNKITMIDLLNIDYKNLNSSKSKTCILCGDTPTITSLNKKNYKHKIINKIEISYIDFSKNLNKYILIDIRENLELEKQNNKYLHFPMSLLPNKISFFSEQLKNNHKYLLFCSHGKRSLQAAIWLRQLGFYNIYSLSGGNEFIKNNK